MKLKNQQSGFSLLEVMLAMSLTIGLTGILFYYMKTAQHTFITENSISDMNQNFRAAVDLISRDIQAAGAGVPLFLGPISGSVGYTGGGINDSDRILILFGDPTKSATNVKAPTPTTPLPTGTSSYIYTDVPTSEFEVGRPYILYAVAQRQDTSDNVSDYAEFSIFTIASSSAVADVTSGGTVIGKRITPTTWAINPSSGTWAHTMSFPSAAALSVVPMDEMIEYLVQKDDRQLMRNRNRTGWVAVARGIDDLDFQYQIERYNTTTSTYDISWVDEPLQSAVSNRALIRNIRFTLSGRTQLEATVDGQGQRRISQTVEVTPRNLNLPGFIPNR